MDADPAEIESATNLLIAAEQAVRYSYYITPTNSREAKRRFFAALDKGAVENPRLEYYPPPTQAAASIDAARAAVPATTFWATIFGRELDGLARALNALVTRECAEQTAYAISQFGSPSPAALEQARNILSGPDTDERWPGAVWPAAAAAKVMASVLHRLRLGQWQVEVDDHMTARMSVLGTRRLVRIRGDAQFPEPEIRRLAVHEIGTHVIRSENGAGQPLKIFGYGVSGYLATEEGLAVWNEQQAGVTEQRVLRRYALRVLACSVAIGASFHSVFSELRPYTSSEEAYAITMRVKRGLIDTSKAGGFLKDHVYLGGAAEVGDHLRRYPADIALLMATKWPLASMDDLKMSRDRGFLHTSERALADVVDATDQAISDHLR